MDQRPAHERAGPGGAAVDVVLADLPVVVRTSAIEAPVVVLAVVPEAGRTVVHFAMAVSSRSALLAGSGAGPAVMRLVAELEWDGRWTRAGQMSEMTGSRKGSTTAVVGAFMFDIEIPCDAKKIGLAIRAATARVVK